MRITSSDSASPVIPGKSRLISVATRLVGLILVLMPFHAFLTVWLNSLVGHYTLLRLWKEILLILLTAVSVYLLARDAPLRAKFLASRLNRLIVAYLILLTTWGVIGYFTHQVSLKSMGYGLIVDIRFLLFFLVVSVLLASGAKQKITANWQKFIFLPATIVILFGLLQYFVLPYDVLRHVGYNESTIFPYETINHNIQYIRIMSTLRGANPLGAYLLVIVSLLAALWLKRKDTWKLALGIAAGIALALTFSRSAWIGVVLALGTVVWASLRNRRSQQLAAVVAVGVVLVIGIAALLFHHNTAFQNTIFHTDDKSKIATSSNEGHASALRDGLRDVVHQPFGLGTGTAGPASVYNGGQVRIAENYFVQIAQEVGWLGIALFIAIQLYVGRALWRKRQEPLALGLLAALVGLTFVNLLSHAWADDTLAYIFWGLTAIALAEKEAVGARRKAVGKKRAKP